MLADHRLLVIQPKGEFSLPKLDAITTFIDEAEGQAGGHLNRFTDISRVTRISINFSDVLNRPGRKKSSAPETNTQIKHAIYAPNSLAYGIGKMHQTFSQLKHMEIRVFLDPYKAAAWLGVPAEELDF